MDEMKNNRELMKSNFPQLKEIETDKQKGLPQADIQKPYDEGIQEIDLPKVEEDILLKANIYSCLRDRRSLRKYTEDQLTQKELSFLLWATQGVEKVVGKRNFATFRPVASGGACHAFETYLVINRVEGLQKGIYRYLHLTHQLILLQEGDFSQGIVEATEGQKFIGTSAVVFIWSCIPYRSEWKYNIAAHKLMLLDAGHMCQNLYLACEAIGQGTCAIGDYDQKKMDEFIGVDSEEEFTIYMAPVGKRA